jgi:predicted amidohydrolase YtcJ
MRILWRGGRVLTPHHPAATAIVTDGPAIAYVGTDEGALRAGTCDEVVDVAGLLVAPAFVDAHVHLTATGLAYEGLDLSGCRSRTELLDAVRRRVVEQPDGPVIGHGWDERTWPDPRVPHRHELDRIAGARPVYLARVDLHAAAISTALLDAAPKAVGRVGFADSGHLTAAAHDAVRTIAYGMLTADQRRTAQRVVRRRAAEHGVALVHELAGPELSSADDLLTALRLSDSEPGPEVVGYWGEVGGVERARELGALGAAGDIFVDGTIGSHTACLRRVYADLDTRGTEYLTAAQIRDHVVACAEAGMQAGFHAIGDAAVDAVIAGFEEAAERVGPDVIRAGRHRIEHLEMTDPPLVARVAALGVWASVQPAFDAFWGGSDGMYAERLGWSRAETMNPFGALAALGVPLVFGSDTPVTPIDPWGTIVAAVHHHNPEYRIGTRAAFAAHTVAGWQAAGRDGVGELVPGAPAHFALWQVDGDGLPELAPGDPLPVCRGTVRAGVRIY